jgi:SAM-dependent methyltransferase
MLEWPLVYGILQAPFATAKLQPFLRNVDVAALKRVLDVGCGPGTNAPVFRASEYVGIDLNPDYIAHASARYSGRFLVGDVSDPAVLPDERFDCVFANSLMHHLADETVRRLLARLAGLTSAGGAVHVLDLVLPAERSLPRMVARLDRGRFARPIEHWRALFAESLREVRFEEYPLGIPGLPLWRMLFFSGVPL